MFTLGRSMRSMHHGLKIENEQILAGGTFALYLTIHNARE
jgi:hypothetical protein